MQLGSEQTDSSSSALPGGQQAASAQTSSTANRAAKTPVDLEIQSVPIAPASTKEYPWSQRQRQGNREDRMFNRVQASIPAKLCNQAIELPAAVAHEAQRVAQDIARSDQIWSQLPTTLGAFLVRSEAVASSKIEYEQADAASYVRALYGSKANASALAMTQNAQALEVLSAGPVDEETLLKAHEKLLATDIMDSAYAGKYRQVQNWIGGSDFSPRGAIYVPPPPDLLPELMKDLFSFCTSARLPTLVTAALAHAQLEAIHPFTDGNGRIGRALAGAIMRQQGLTTHANLPIAGALLAKRDEYFHSLSVFHRGEAGPLLHLWLQACAVTVEETRKLPQIFSQMRTQWLEQSGYPRQGSATRLALEYLFRNGSFTTEQLVDQYGLSSSALSRTVNLLSEQGIIVGLTQRKRGQIWASPQWLEQVDTLQNAISQRMNSHR